jgi:hypothetical protein
MNRKRNDNNMENIVLELFISEFLVSNLFLIQLLLHMCTYNELGKHILSPKRWYLAGFRTIEYFGIKIGLTYFSSIFIFFLIEFGTCSISY